MLVKGFRSWNILDRMRYYKVPGINLAVIKDYKINWEKGYGLADTTENINLRLMRKGACISNRYHFFELADQALNISAADFIE